MYFTSLLPLFYFSSTLFLTLAVQPTCYLDDYCDVNGAKMQEAISLIPVPVSFPTTHDLRPDAYHVPAIFEATDKAQILIRVLSITGVALNAETLMTHLWPSARQHALQMFNDCDMEVLGFSGKMTPTVRWWSGSQRHELKYRLDMTCEIDRMGMYPELGVITYSASGVAVSRVGRNFTDD